MVFKLVQHAEHPVDRTFQILERVLRTPLKGLLGIVCGASLWVSSSQPAVAQEYCRADLVEQIDAISNRPDLTQAHIGILVEQQGSTAAERHVIVERNTDKWFVPASTLKLLTTAAALQHLGPDFQIKTSVYATQQDNKTHLYIMGRGDPTFTDTDLDNLVQQIVQQGLQHIDYLWGYDGYFSGRAVHPNWEWEDVLAGYGASANGLILNENAIGVTLYPTELGQPLRVEWPEPTQAARWQVNNTSLTVTTGEPITADVGRDWSQPILHVFGNLPIDAGPDPFALAITQPGIHFIEQFETRLSQAGITVVADGLTPSWPSLQLTEIATITSPALSEWLPIINQDSNNLYAEALLKSLGRSTGNPNDAIQAGTEVVQETLSDVGIAANSYQMVDGSGLSRHNLVTPRTLVDTLQSMAYNSHGNLYRRSLTTAGEDGGLNYRYRNAPIQVKLQAKTGYVSNNESLAGYLQPSNHPPLVFSIFLNNAALSATDMRKIIDEIVVNLAQLNDC
ncbi:D-alanyl-D-alanine carboxypeptidase/D-alanyl-D-alanine endopeptidase [Leptothoe spongobia]|uniref:D-alanyl-D-alanine carboxypeptidase/D-alanyl-D-alanine-endopeptidase n=1 Tax=Leptothoe spongobia TAU-MAC 1115 TaxID=1967444 RepID=A0A947DD55_9CYAN|nr:D-alanyl-D-alanine carboxypeptidase/D-alanyl-D-alanine-endopeptidase [Leptothoe spongobia]MBT9314174.1 D-alanyl-D-alanine carboxypeptidase/D-alanyl-D-alanine-endopeptidase [Leptothoe spongobia TAU-MAC 1115]